MNKNNRFIYLICLVFIFSCYDAPISKRSGTFYNEVDDNQISDLMGLSNEDIIKLMDASHEALILTHFPDQNLMQDETGGIKTSEFGGGSSLSIIINKQKEEVKCLQISAPNPYSYKSDSPSSSTLSPPSLISPSSAYSFNTGLSDSPITPSKDDDGEEDNDVNLEEEKKPLLGVRTSSSIEKFNGVFSLSKKIIGNNFSPSAIKRKWSSLKLTIPSTSPQDHNKKRKEVVKKVAYLLDSLKQPDRFAQRISRVDESFYHHLYRLNAFRQSLALYNLCEDQISKALIEKNLPFIIKKSSSIWEKLKRMVENPNTTNGFFNPDRIDLIKRVLSAIDSFSLIPSSSFYSIEEFFRGKLVEILRLENSFRKKSVKTIRSFISLAVNLKNGDEKDQKVSQDINDDQGKENEEKSITLKKTYSSSVISLSPTISSKMTTRERALSFSSKIRRKKSSSLKPLRFEELDQIEKDAIEWIRITGITLRNAKIEEESISELTFCYGKLTKFLNYYRGTDVYHLNGIISEVVELNYNLFTDVLGFLSQIPKTSDILSFYNYFLSFERIFGGYAGFIREIHKGLKKDDFYDEENLDVLGGILENAKLFVKENRENNAIEDTRGDDQGWIKESLEVVKNTLETIINEY